MAVCINGAEILVGRSVILEVCDGCPDVVPDDEEFKALGALTSKSKDYSPNTVTSEADDTLGYVETFTISSDLTVSVEGEVRQNDRLDEYGVTNLEIMYNTELKARRQPGIWVRMVMGTSLLKAYMNITSLSMEAGTNDIVSFSVEFKPADARSIDIKNTTVVPPVTQRTVFSKE